MAIIKTYPLKTTYFSNDRFILSDMQPDSNGVVHGHTKNITFSDIKSILAIPANIVSGTGTAGTIPKWSASNTLTNSDIYEFSVHKYVGIGISNPQEKLEVSGNVRISGNLQFFKDANSIKISTPSTITTSYELVMPAQVGAASQVLKLPSEMGTSPYQLAWGDASASSGTGGFETLPFATANGYITSTGSYVFQMIAPSSCTPANFKFYNFLAQPAERVTAVAIYKGDINNGGSLQSTGEISGVLDANQISGSTLTLETGATAISAGDNILVCLSFNSNISPLGVIPITASGGTTLTNASPVSNEKLALFDGTSFSAASQFPATISGLLTTLSGANPTTTRPFLLIY